jgi:O-antigen ligase
MNAASAALELDHPPASLLAKGVLALLMAVAFWSISSKLDRSRELRDQIDVSFGSMKNEYAERGKDTTSSSAFGYFLIGAAGIGCWLHAGPGRLRWNHPLLLAAVLYLGWVGLSLAWSIEPILSLRKSAIVGLLVIGGAGIGAKFQLEEFLEIVVMVLTGMLLVDILIELAMGTFVPWRSDYRFSGTVHPNDRGLNCALLVMAAWCLVGPARSGWRWRPVIIAVALAGLWFSKSRTSLAALVFAGAVYVILRTRGSQRWLVISACVTFAGIGAVLYNFGTYSALRELTNVAEMGRHESVNTLTGRLPLWRDVVLAVERRPVMGHGFGGFWGAKNILWISERNGWHIPHAHNAYLDLMLGVGLIGLTLYLAWVLATAAAATIRYERSGRFPHLFVVCLVGFSLVHGITESKLPGGGVAGFVMIAVMMMQAIQRSAVGDLPAAVPVTARRGGRTFQPLKPREWPMVRAGKPIVSHYANSTIGRRHRNKLQ